jgi:exopolysaccharide biosynthesis polyprenyl glycosylphosphotransferase
VLLLGTGPLACRIARGLTHASPGLYEIVTPDCLDGGAGREAAEARAPESLMELVRAGAVDEVVLPGGPSGAGGVLAAASAWRLAGCRLRSELDFHEDVFRSVPLAEAPPEWLAGLARAASSRAREGLKRISDVVLALLLLVASAPLFLMAIVVLRLTSGSPVFYRQARVGRYGRPFSILKLRTMRVDAEVDRPRWAEPGDPRRTRAGRVLRRTRIDELPQLINVLRGEMSFVGPRPERPEFVRELAEAIPAYHLRHVVRPGLTGWAQISYPYGATVEDARRKLEYDLYYVRHASIVTDLSIVLRTVVAGTRGAR